MHHIVTAKWASYRGTEKVHVVESWTKRGKYQFRRWSSYTLADPATRKVSHIVDAAPMSCLLVLSDSSSASTLSWSPSLSGSTPPVRFPQNT